MIPNRGFLALAWRSFSRGGWQKPPRLGERRGGRDDKNCSFTSEGGDFARVWVRKEKTRKNGEKSRIAPTGRRGFRKWTRTMPESIGQSPLVQKELGASNIGVKCQKGKKRRGEGRVSLAPALSTHQNLGSVRGPDRSDFQGQVTYYLGQPDHVNATLPHPRKSKSEKRGRHDCDSTEPSAGKRTLP